MQIKYCNTLSSTIMPMKIIILSMKDMTIEKRMYDTPSSLMTVEARRYHLV
jgi:hypothetical protein